MTTPNGITKTIVRRVPLPDRVLQVLTAVAILRERGLAHDFTSRDVVNQIDPRLPTSTLNGALSALVGVGVLRNLTPENTRFRHYEVMDFEKARTYRDALSHPTDDRTRQAVARSLWHAIQPLPTTVMALEVDPEPATPAEPPAPPPTPEPVFHGRLPWWRRWWRNRPAVRLRRMEQKLDRLLAIWDD